MGFLTPAFARAQEASFDCLKAAAPIELLICSDPDLIVLDGSLGSAFEASQARLPAEKRAAALTEQRAWLAQRLTRCEIPSRGDEISPSLRWRAAPCLDELYRARLSALGAPAAPTPQPPNGVAEAGFIHPACLWSLVEQDPETGMAARVPIAACTLGNRHIPVTETDDGGWSAESASDGYPIWLSYRILGKVASGGDAAVISYNSGGSGHFSEIYVLRRAASPDHKDTMLTGEIIGGGGDRCNGGIDQAKLLDANTLQVDFNVTPQDLLSEADEDMANDNIDALAFCAICCTGTVRRTIDVTSKNEKTISATVVELVSDDADMDEDEGAQKCFDGLIHKAAPTLPHTFSLADLKALAASFSKTCLKTEHP
ncbi:MAG: hypothetical protein IPK66_05030 [Rhodospirillales bacterium]|nr:hypothetical protein [Rhodospirillales bacterium]